MMWVSAVLVVVCAAAASYLAMPTAELTLTAATGYSAKILCDYAFVQTDRNDDVFDHELLGVFKHLDWSLDHQGHRVTVSVPYFEQISRTAVYREGLGCTLVHPQTGKVVEPHLPYDLKPKETRGMPWPTGDVFDDDRREHVKAAVDLDKVEAALDEAFAEKPGTTRKQRKNTRATVVVYDGELIAERYGSGFTKDSRLAGWSMTKSLTSALTGIRLMYGQMDLQNGPPLFFSDHWTADGPLNSITLDHLLHMNDGIDFKEEYHQWLARDPSIMLFTEPSASDFAAGKEAKHEAGTRWYYSSGTSNLLSRAIRASFETPDLHPKELANKTEEERAELFKEFDPLKEYFEFPRRELFDRIGMQSMVMEPDAQGTFVGSSFAFATARDWARFGMLYLGDGKWLGDMILPEGWVSYTRMPAPNSNRRYGAHWWLGGPDGDTRWPRLPKGTFVASGYEGQFVVVVPSKRLVVVRLGLTKDKEAFSIEDLVSGIVDALPESFPSDSFTKKNTKVKKQEKQQQQQQQKQKQPAEKTEEQLRQELKETIDSRDGYVEASFLDRLNADEQEEEEQQQ